MNARLNPPQHLLDPDGEGVYFHDGSGFLLQSAAVMLFGDAREWRNVNIEVVHMQPREGTDEWVPWQAHRFCPRYWRLNLPRRWRPVTYLYCTPKP